jgi:hypothetical protein
VVRKALTRKGLPLLAAVALLTGPLVASAQALPAAPPLAGQASRTQPAIGQSTVNQPAINPAHIKVLAAALKKMHDNYASFANFTPGPQDIFDYNIANAISISDGTGEGTYSFGTAQIHANDPGPLAAAAAGIPVTNATGDCGVVQNLAVANAQCGNTSAGPRRPGSTSRAAGAP